MASTWNLTSPPDLLSKRNSGKHPGEPEPEPGHVEGGSPGEALFCCYDWSTTDSPSWEACWLESRPTGTRILEVEPPGSGGETQLREQKSVPCLRGLPGLDADQTVVGCEDGMGLQVCAFSSFVPHVQPCAGISHEDERQRNNGEIRKTAPGGQWTQLRMRRPAYSSKPSRGEASRREDDSGVREFTDLTVPLAS